MSKLPAAYQFTDLSDYGRTPARWIANSLKNTRATPIHVTLAFGIVGLIACYFILSHHFIGRDILILKSILDAADGELARVKATLLIAGDIWTLFDILLNFSARLYLVCYFWTIDHRFVSIHRDSAPRHVI